MKRLSSEDPSEAFVRQLERGATVSPNHTPCVATGPDMRHTLERAHLAELASHAKSIHTGMDNNRDSPMLSPDIACEAPQEGLKLAEEIPF